MQKPNPLACIGTKIKNNLYNVVFCYVYLTKKGSHPHGQKPSPFKLQCIKYV